MVRVAGGGRAAARSAPVTDSPVVIRKRSPPSTGAVPAAVPATRAPLRPDDRPEQVRGADEHVHVVVPEPLRAAARHRVRAGSSSTMVPPQSNVSNENRSPAANDSGRTTPSRSPGPRPSASCVLLGVGDLLPVRQDDALRHAGRAGGEDDGEGIPPAGTHAHAVRRRGRAGTARVQRFARVSSSPSACTRPSRSATTAAASAARSVSATISSTPASRATCAERAAGRRSSSTTTVRPARTSARIADHGLGRLPAISPTGFDAPPGGADAGAAVVVGSERHGQAAAERARGPVRFGVRVGAAVARERGGVAPERRPRGPSGPARSGRPPRHRLRGGSRGSTVVSGSTEVTMTPRVLSSGPPRLPRRSSDRRSALPRPRAVEIPVRGTATGLEARLRPPGTVRLRNDRTTAVAPSARRLAPARGSCGSAQPPDQPWRDRG